LARNAPGVGVVPDAARGGPRISDGPAWSLPITTLVATSIDIDKVSDVEIEDIVITANLTPRKCLGSRLLQAILKELGKDVQMREANLNG
jgi:hypothetical protein